MLVMLSTESSVVFYFEELLTEAMKCVLPLTLRGLLVSSSSSHVLPVLVSVLVLCFMSFSG